MPRGIPKAKSDDSAMRYTTFHVPLPPNPKHMASSYLKSESNVHWARKARRDLALEPGSTPPASKRGFNTIVIHPGSSVLRIGRASDTSPKCVPSTVARKQSPVEGVPVHVEGPSWVDGIVRPRRTASSKKAGAKGGQSQEGEGDGPKDEYSVSLDSDDPFEQKLAALQVSLRDRMHFYKLRVTPNASSLAASYNDSFTPERVSEADDPEYLRIRESLDGQEVLVGDEAMYLASSPKLSASYILRRPLSGPNFNMRDYPSSLQLLLADLEALVKGSLESKLGLRRQDWVDMNVILLIPDFWNHAYVREWAQLLLGRLGFKRLCVQQESLAATYGAGISSACVVDVGAVSTSVACVDDGLVISDTRMQLLMGGNDVTEFLFVLLRRIGFPYRDANLSRSYDWEVLEDLKRRCCTLTEADVALNLYDFTVRRPGKPTEKYGLRAYDEIILAPMCVFEPRVIEFDRKRLGTRPPSHPDVSEEVVELTGDHVTQAMMISTQHLLPQILTPSVMEVPPLAPPLMTPAEHGILVEPPSDAPAGDVEAKEEAAPSEMDVDVDGDKPSVDSEVPSSALPASEAATPLATPSATSAPAFLFGQASGPAGAAPAGTPPALAIDVAFEAAKLPLDVAIFNSARAAGGDDKIRKYLQAVLVVGAGASVPGMPHALESRLQAIATPLVPGMEKVQIIPPPKGIEPGNLVWKGAAVLAKMESVSDLWITLEDWDIFGMRALRDRCFYL